MKFYYFLVDNYKKSCLILLLRQVRAGYQGACPHREPNFTGLSWQTPGWAGQDCPRDGAGGRIQRGKNLILRHGSVSRQHPRLPHSGRSPALPPQPQSQISDHWLEARQLSDVYCGCCGRHRGHPEGVLVQEHQDPGKFHGERTWWKSIGIEARPFPELWSLSPSSWHPLMRLTAETGGIIWIFKCDLFIYHDYLYIRC